MTWPWLLVLLVYTLGAVQGIALVVLLFRLDPRARKVLRRGPALVLGGAFWPLWAAGGVVLLASWVIAYPWRRRIAEDRAVAEGRRT